MPSSREKITVLIVDDHPGMREGISSMIAAQPDMIIVGEATNGREAIEQFKNLHPSITLTDIHLPVICGIEAIELLRAEFPKARFIVITAHDDDNYIRRAFTAGAQAFLHKHMLRRELLPAIRAVHEGRQYIPQSIADRL